ncbi:MAG: thioredoxin family protein [Marinifilaceae bacterium]|jgi:small redox-active disulfide protein 2|nr:thioredoxin family protein [Marinifilaceae bacterium]
MDIKVLGTGCSKCKTVEKNVTEAVAELKIEATVTKVEDIMEIMEYNVMKTPAVVVNGEVVSTGRIPSVSDIKSLLTK